MIPVNPYEITGATMALTRGAISRAIATGTRMSVPLGATPCGSSVPSGSRTVWIFAGTHSRNSIQLIRSISQVLGASFLVVLIEADDQQHARPVAVFLISLDASF